MPRKRMIPIHPLRRSHFGTFSALRPISGGGNTTKPTRYYRTCSGKKKVKPAYAIKKVGQI